MKREVKSQIIDGLKNKLQESPFFYITDASTLTVEQVNNLRGLCFEKDVEMQVVKNTFVKKAMETLPEELGFDKVYDVLKGPTALMFSATANAPGKILKEFRKIHDKPVLKAAYIQTDVYVGDDQIDTLASLKSKEDLIGDVILLLQSPAKNVISALQSGGNIISGLVKALEERAN